MGFPGLAQDPKSLQLLAGLVEAAMKSPLKGKKLSGKFASCHPLFKSVSGRVFWSSRLIFPLTVAGMSLRNTICSACNM